MGGGWIGKLRYQRSEGAFFELDEEFTAKGVAERWEEITDFSRVSHPRTTQEGFEPVLRTLTHSKDKGRMPTVQRSSVVFERLAASVKEQVRCLFLIHDMYILIRLGSDSSKEGEWGNSMEYWS